MRVRFAFDGILKSARRTSSRFARSERGNVAMMFAAALLPMMAFIGAAIDYSRAVNVRSAMQAAVDSTALMISKDAASMTSAQISAKATQYFNALFNRPEASGVTISTVYTANTGSGSTVAITGSGSIATEFMKMVGYPTLAMNVSSTTTWGSSKLRVALVLDNTGSMSSSNKMSAMQTAAKNLIDKLKASAKTDGDVLISIVPFAKDVNVGAANYTQNWVKWDDWDNDNQNCSGRWPNQVCTKKDHVTWNGCVTDRDQNYDTNIADPVNNNKATQYPAEQYDACPVSLMGLSYDWTSLKAKVDAMTPNGGTNQAIGLQWGWQTLSLTGPFPAPAKDPNFLYQQVVILLSDGLNTQDRWYGNGSSWSQSVDNRQALLCANVKAAGVTLYTIQVNTGGDPTSSILQSCASSSDKFFQLTTANQVISTFDAIGTALSKLRLKS